MQSIISVVPWIVVSAAAGVIGAIASIDAASFYLQLQRPSWAPPAWVFGPVWMVLYLLIGIAAGLVWRERETRSVALPQGLFVTQLALNALWSWLFFAWHRGGWALADIVALLLLVVATTIAFARARPAAALLMLPYLAWLTFAAVLNFAVWRANPGLLGG